MGSRFRKSINLGGGFKINISKSGVGYSWGVKGYRITKTARGTIRKTTSIPGTGFSYVEETGSNSPKYQDNNVLVNCNSYLEQEFSNEMDSLSNSKNCDEILLLAMKTLKLNKIATIGTIISLVLSLFIPFLILFFIVFLSLLIYVRVAGTIDLDYDIDEETLSSIESKMLPMVKVAECAKTWRILSSNRVMDTKYSAGATSTLKRVNCTASRNAVFPFRSKSSAVSFITPQETIIFLPDKLYVIQDTKIVAVDYSDMQTKASVSRFVEEEGVPIDAKVVDRTWQYVNKSGGPDRRFKCNRELPICLYGQLELSSTTGLNTIIMFSKSELNTEPEPQSEFQPRFQPQSIPSNHNEDESCGVNRFTYGLLAIFLGSFGIHKFYAGHPIQGILYLVFCWTLLPQIIAFIEGIIALTKSGKYIEI